MAGSKQTPRQKMIGMMYLVLTALLALNVSKDILHSFVVINESLESTNDNFTSKNGSTMNQFEQQMAFDPMKTKPFFDKAISVVTASELIDHRIESLKAHLIRSTAGYDESTPDSMYLLRNVKKLDDRDVPTDILIGSEPSSPISSEHSAVQLKKEIEAYRESIISLFDPSVDGDLIAEVNEGLALRPVPKPEGGYESWETGNFYHLPLAAVVTNLTKLQADIKNAEADALKSLFKNIRLNDFKFDTIEAKVIPHTNYVLRGEPYEAEVFLAAYSRTEQPDMFLEKYDAYGNFLMRDSLQVEAGLGRISLPTDALGLQSYDGVIQLKKEDGSIEDFRFKDEYMVAEPSLTVAPTSMNVLYIGVDNPIEISVPGVANENISASISGGNTLRKVGNGKYIAELRRDSPRNISVGVTATLSGDQQRSMGSKPFRVKQLPKPYAMVGDIESVGRMANAELIAHGGVHAIYDKDFPFNLQCTVKEFKVMTKYKGDVLTPVSNSKRWTNEMKTIFQALRSGTQVTIFDIKAEGSDGVQHKIGPLVVTIK